MDGARDRHLVEVAHDAQAAPRSLGVGALDDPIVDQRARDLLDVERIAVGAASPDITVSDRLEQAGLVAMFGVAAALQFSIAIAQSLMAVAVFCFLALTILRKERIEVPRFFVARVARSHRT